MHGCNISHTSPKLHAHCNVDNDIDTDDRHFARELKSKQTEYCKTHSDAFRSPLAAPKSSSTTAPASAALSKSVERVRVCARAVGKISGGRSTCDVGNGSKFARGSSSESDLSASSETSAGECKSPRARCLLAGSRARDKESGRSSLIDKNSHLSLIQSTVTSKQDPDGRGRHHIQSESLETKSSVQRYSVHFCQCRSAFEHSCSLACLYLSAFKC